MVQCPDFDFYENLADVPTDIGNLFCLVEDTYCKNRPTCKCHADYCKRHGFDKFYK